MPVKFFTKCSSSRNALGVTGVLLALVCGLWTTASAFGASDLIYVESNITTPNQNSVFGFQNDGKGNLSMIAGSPFLTGGTGFFDSSFALGPFDSDQNVIVDREHDRLFAVNSGSNTIAVFDIQPNGALVPIAGSPFPSGGTNPVSIGLRDGVLVVVNKDQDPNQNSNTSLPNYSSFRLNHDGALSPSAAATVPVAYGSSPSQALIAKRGRLLFGADFLGGLLQSMVLLSNGRLVQNPPQALPDSEFSGSMAPHLPLGLTTHPDQNILYAGLVTLNKLGVFTYSPSGRLTFVRTVLDSGSAICWIVTNDDGSRLYASNTADNSISVFNIEHPLNPIEIQHLSLAGPGSAFQLALGNDQRFLYVVGQGASATTAGDNSLHVLEVNPSGGTLKEVSSSPVSLPVPTDTRPQGAAVF